MTLPPIAREIFRDLGILFLLIDKGFDRVYALWKKLYEVEEFVEHRHGDRRHIMEIEKLVTEGPALVEAILKLEKDLQADWALVAPQNPALVGDIAVIRQKAQDIFGTPK